MILTLFGLDLVMLGTIRLYEYNIKNIIKNVTQKIIWIWYGYTNMSKLYEYKNMYQNLYNILNITWYDITWEKKTQIIISNLDTEKMNVHDTRH